MEIKSEGKPLKMPTQEMLPSVEESPASVPDVLRPPITDLIAK